MDRKVLLQQVTEIFCEEAAPGLINKYYEGNRVKLAKKCLEFGFSKGIERGFKEAIIQAKEWMKENVGEYTGYGDFDPRGLIMHFETDMNKILEEKI